MKKYALLESEGCNIEDLNKELRSKYSVDLNAPAHEIVYCGAMRQVSEAQPISPPKASPPVPPLHLHSSKMSLADQHKEIAGATTARSTRALPGSEVRSVTARITRMPPAEELETATPSEFDGYTNAGGDINTGAGQTTSFIANIIANTQANTHYLDRGYEIKTNARPRGRTASLPIAAHGPERLSARYTFSCCGV